MKSGRSKSAMKGYHYIKRGIDIILSGMAIVILSPLLLFLCIAIKLDTPGPILFKQKRVGIHRSFFQIYKFRTMRIDTPKDVPTHMLENPEQYITKVGKFLYFCPSASKFCLLCTNISAASWPRRLPPMPSSTSAG